jgi:hypothetical protein
MHDRYDDRHRGDPYSSGRGFAHDDRNFLERAGDEVRSWFGREEGERPRPDERDRYRQEPERYRERSRHDWSADRGTARHFTSERGTTRDWAPERWERTDRWSGDRGANAYRTWNDRDDRFVAPGDYREWTRQGFGTSAPQQSGPRGIYEDDRGMVHRFQHTDDQLQHRDFRGRGPKGYQRSDERIREDVCDRLTMDPEIDATNVEVAVANAEVTLSGVVNSRGDKRHAEDLVEEIVGVREVHNNLRVSRG